MSKSPLVSVILTTRNESGNIERVLRSIQKQSYPNIEIVVVDNNSIDATVSIAKKFTSKVFTFGPERSAQRNCGAKKSKGDYLLFLDADMELTKVVIAECVALTESAAVKIITIPEATKGDSFIAKIRKFEREMYMGEPDYEVARFFERNLFFEHKGYDDKLTGPEDYDLPYRMSRKNKIGRISSYLYHHEAGITLKKQLTKKYYYAKKGAYYAVKHPRLVKVQGTILFRKVYLKNWSKFAWHPIIGLTFLAVRFLETVWAVAGFISAVGISGFFKTLANLLR